LSTVDVAAGRQNRAGRQPTATLGLALSDDEVDYLLDIFTKAGRNPTDGRTDDVRPGQFRITAATQIFNASWVIDGEKEGQDAVRHDSARRIRPTRRARSWPIATNASIIEGATIQLFYPDADRGYSYKEELTQILTKVETQHNHPTAISPLPGCVDR
jgi:phosphoribosylformylglycinamidine synthase